MILRKLSRFLSRSRGNKKSRGAILFMAVGTVAVLSILVIGTTSAVMQQLKLAKYITDADTSCFLASSALEITRELFYNDASPYQATLYDLRKRVIPLDTVVLQVSFADEQALVNLHKADSAVLSRLPGLSDNSSFVDEIAGAGTNLAVKEDILLLAGADEEIYNKFKDEITIFGDGVVNFNTATSQTLQYLGMDEALIAKIIEFRNGDDAVEATLDDRYFDSTANIVTSLEPYGLSLEETALLNSLIASGLLATTSDFIRLHVIVGKAGKSLAVYDIVMNLSMGKAVFWHEA